MDALTAFFLGQLSLAILSFAFIKFFIFGEPPATPHHTRTRRASSSASSSLLRHPRLRHKRSAVLRAGASTSSTSTSTALLSPSTILSKTYYNVAGHQPETLDWFNVLVAQTLAQLRTEALHDDVMLKSLSAALNGAAKPDFLGSIAVTEMSLGDEFPIFSNCRIIPVDEAGVQVKTVDEGTRLLARLDVDLSDAITLGVETKLVLNFPLPTVAVLPVALAVSVVRFSGTLSISFIPATPPVEPPAADTSSPPFTKGTNTPINNASHHTAKPGATPPPSSAPQTTLAFSFLPDYRLDLSVRSLVGSRSRLQDVPKIAQLVEARIHAWLDERCVEPRYQQISLPSMWPRKHNTRGGADDDDDDDDDDEDHVADDDVDDTLAGAGRDEEEGEATETEGRTATIPAFTNASNTATATATATSTAGAKHDTAQPTYQDSLEARMAIEGRKLRAASAADHQRHNHHHHHHQLNTTGTIKTPVASPASVADALGATSARAAARPGAVDGAARATRTRTGRNHSMEKLRMPGRFD